MKRFLEAQDAFVGWLDGDAACDPTPGEVEHKLRSLAGCAVERGMSDLHWIFIVDGLVAHAKRRCPDNALLPGYIGRGNDLSSQWAAIKATSALPH